MSDHLAELETAAKIAREAAVLVRSYRGKRLHIESKPGNEPVTEADKAANTLILQRLSAAFPKDVILSEEVPDSGARAMVEVCRGVRAPWLSSTQAPPPTIPP